MRPLAGVARWLGRLGRGDTRSELDVWRRGELEAERFLRRAGYRLLARNVRTRVGEVDLLFESPERAVVVVEVKARVAGDGDRRMPERAITRAKGRKLAALARSLGRRYRGRAMRIDVVAVDFGPGGRAEVRHYPGAIDAGGGRAG